MAEHCHFKEKTLFSHSTALWCTLINPSRNGYKTVSFASNDMTVIWYSAWIRMLSFSACWSRAEESENNHWRRELLSHTSPEILSPPQCSFVCGWSISITPWLNCAVFFSFSGKLNCLLWDLWLDIKKEWGRIFNVPESVTTGFLFCFAVLRFILTTHRCTKINVHRLKRWNRFLIPYHLLYAPFDQLIFFFFFILDDASALLHFVNSAWRNT